MMLATGLVLAETPPGVVVVTPDLDVTLRTDGAAGRWWYAGVDHTVAEVINPTLTVRRGAVVRVVLVNGDGDRHDLVIPALNVRSAPLAHAGAETEVVFRATHIGRFDYFCSTPGHREAGMAGRLVVGEPASASLTLPAEGGGIAHE
jgi:nitrite reductase (NO-forming)